MKNKPNTNTRRVLVAASVAVLTFVVYLPALRNGFVNWDDDSYLYLNPHISPMDARFFKWAFFDFHSANWHPLTWISHAVDYAVWGMNPLGHHLTSIVLHAANTVLAVFLITGLLEAAKYRTADAGGGGFLSNRAILSVGAVVGLLFGLHPLHVESVAWVSERKDVLCALFYLFSILSYVKYAGGANEKGPWPGLTNKYYIAAVGSAALALLSKPMAVTIPAVLLILDYYPFQRLASAALIKRAFVEKIPFFVMSLGSSVVTIMAQSSEEAVIPLKLISTPARMITAANALILYIGKMTAPVGLSAYYPYPDEVSLLSFRYLLPVLLVVAATTAAVVIAARSKLWLAAWSYYVITLLPVIGIVQVGMQSMADRYTYLPGLGPFLIAGVGAIRGFEKASKQRTATAAFISGAVIILVLLCAATVNRIGIWRDGFTLWSHVIEKEPRRVPVAYYNRGVVYHENGNLTKAVEDYTAAIALSPGYTHAFNNRGIAYDQLGQHDSAIKDFSMAISLKPDYVEAYANRGVGYRGMGLYDMALNDFNKAIDINPNYDKAFFNRGGVFYLKGEYERAVRDIDRSIELNPANSHAYIIRQNIYAKMRSEAPSSSR